MCGIAGVADLEGEDLQACCGRWPAPCSTEVPTRTAILNGAVWPWPRGASASSASVTVGSRSQMKTEPFRGFQMCISPARWRHSSKRCSMLRANSSGSSIL